ncbi:F-box only protein 40 isoform X2 [Anolis carolinensis]|uniref:F-box protein 40 n=1 Tax=Anolis carolinensis TaxID=28377 RepID=H9GBC5_ANOCA|nr:PREDICTED: F-box only protein 40 isoform X2 [Anolis carolinensis]|eukprot:XP_008118671.1 PREDICTED: F-box only protein 40 isoform X2 [Anolis carolinensis]
MYTGHRNTLIGVMGKKQQIHCGLHKHCEKCFNRYCQVPVEPTVSCVVISCRSRCGAAFHMCKEDEHQLLCPLEQVSCLNSVYGCPFTMARFKMAKHLQVCPASVVSCSMEWNRWPCVESEAILHENIMKEEPREDCLDVALAMKDQKGLFGALKMAELFPECKEEEIDANDEDIGDESAERATGDFEANYAHPAELSQHEREHLAKDKEGMDLAGYKTWESMFSKELKACNVTGASADNGKQKTKSKSLNKGQSSKSSVLEESNSVKESEAQSPSQINLAAEKTGLAPWQDGVLERLKTEVPIAEYNMYLVHHGRMLIHFGQMPACTPREKDFVYGNLEANEMKTEITFKVPTSYCGRRARLGDPTAHKKPTKNISVDTSDLGVNLEELPKCSAIKTTLLCALEKELKGHEISQTKSTDALYVDFGTQTYRFAMEPFTSTTVLSDILDVKDPPNLNLQLHSESVTQRHNKSSSAFTFSCNHFFRRDEFPSHFKNVHTDIQSCLNGWFQHRCPLAYLGCTFVQYPLCPSGQRSNVIYSQDLNTFAVKPEVDPVLLQINKNKLIRNSQVKEMDVLSSLPLEILKYIAGFLDSFSLSQLAQVSVQMRDICATLLQERGMVFLLWEKKRYSHGGTSWRIRKKIWKFSNLFSTINNWQFSDIPSMAVHLKTCPFYDVEHKKDPVLLTSMLSSEEEVQETLVSTLRRGCDSKKNQKRLF